MARRPKQTALERVEELRQEAAAVRQEERSLELERQAAEAAREEARESLVAAFAAGADGSEEQEALEQAEVRAATRWDEHREAIRRRIRAADAAVINYITSNFSAIKEEKVALDDAATERFRAAAEELQEATKQLHHADTAWSPLVAATGENPAQTAAALNLDELRSVLKGILMRGAPSPTPRPYQRGGEGRAAVTSDGGITVLRTAA